MAKIDKQNIKKPIGNIWGKVPPQAPEIEEAILAAVMLERNAYEQAAEIIHSCDCFYVDAHQKIWKAMNDLYASGRVVDLLTITDQLKRSNELELVGGEYYLTGLTMAVTSSAHIQGHCLIVMEKFMQREVIRICGAAIAEAYNDGTDVFEIMDSVENGIKNITSGISNLDDTHIGSSYQNVIERYEEQKKTKSDLIGLDTGFKDFNSITGGIPPSGLIIIGAYPSEGKTALMLELCRNIEALNKNNGRCKIFSLETTNLSLTARMAASQNHIPLEDLRKGRLKPLEEQLLYKGMHIFNAKRISISIKIHYIEEIEKACRKAKKKYPDLGAIFLDFIQLVRMRNPGKLGKYEIVGEVSRKLKLLSQEIETPIIALSQLNSEARKNKDAKPRAEHLANSVELSQNADMVIFIWYGEIDGSKEKQPYLVIAKQKDGKTGDMKIKFDATYQTWSDFDEFNRGENPSYITTNADSNFQKKAVIDDEAPF